MKKFTLIIALAMMLLLTACNGNSKPAETGKEEQKASENQNTSSDTIVIKVGHVEPEVRSTHQELLTFKENVEERSNGSIKVELYPNGALGGDVQLTESVALGTLDAALPSTSVFTAYTDEIGVLDMPYLFKDSQAAFNAMDGKVGEHFNKQLEEHNLYNLGYSYNGPRSTTTSVRPIEKVADLKGIKMRVMESPIFIDFYTTLGANATPMSFTELYTGLQQGTVEAQENPPSLIFTNKFYEVQKYLSVDEHVHNFLAFIMNKEKFDGLTEEQKTILMEEGKDFVKRQREKELVDNEDAIEKLGNEGGLEVNHFTEEQKQEFKDALKPMHEKYEKEFGAEIFSLCEEYNK